MKSLQLTEYFAGDKFGKNEMGGKCGAYGERSGLYRLSMGK